MFEKSPPEIRWFVASLFALFLATASCAHAAEDTDPFIAGLDAMASGAFDQAAKRFGDAAKTKPDALMPQLDRGVALFVLGNNNDARDAFAQASKIDSQNGDLRVWSLARAMMFDSAMPMLLLPSENVPYSRQLLSTIVSRKSADESGQAKIKTTIEDIARKFARDQRNGLVAIKAYYGDERYHDALALIDPLLVKQPHDNALLAYAGHCKLGLKDYEGSRQSYTESLHVTPLEPGCLIGRGRCEIHLGALEPAEVDLTLARQINDKSMSGLLSEADDLLSKAKAQHSAAAPPPTRREQYTRELCRLQLDVRDHPKDAGPLAALVQFYLEPTAVCQITLDGAVIQARVPCGKMELDNADRIVAQAVKMAPDQPDVILQQARVYYAQGRLDQMKIWANRAMTKSVMDPELAGIYLDYDNYTARGEEGQANALTSGGQFYDSYDFSKGSWVKTYVGPNANAFTRADELRKQAKSLRDDAVRPLQLLQKLTANKSDASSRAANHMVDSYFDYWNGNLNGAIQNAQSALAVDPVNVLAVRFLIVCGKKGNVPVLEKYRALYKQLDDRE
jgi:Tfp pilus assembly protein PilF